MRIWKISVSAVFIAVFQGFFVRVESIASKNIPTTKNLFGVGQTDASDITRAKSATTVSIEKFLITNGNVGKKFFVTISL